MVVEEVYGGRLMGREQEVLECVAGLEHVLMGCFESGHAPTKEQRNLDERAARTMILEGWRLNLLVEVVPVMFGSPQRRHAAATWTRSVIGLIERGYSNDALRPMYKDHVLSFVPTLAESILPLVSPEANAVIARAVCLPFFGLMAQSEPEPEMAA